ncbi:MAG: glycosyltransferase family 2 protein [Actinomycetota bacterium]|nr:glycosyltransferase [Actinomycetota bacterium]
MTQGISVVIPTHNRLEYLKEAVGSVLHQEGDWSLTVVMDACTDGTAAWLKELSDPRVSAVALESGSERSAARNRGLDDAKGGLVVFLDDDDHLAPKGLIRLEAALDQHEEAVAAVGAMMHFNDKGQKRRSDFPRRFRVLDMADQVMFGFPASPGSTMFRTRLLRDLGGWPMERDVGRVIPHEDQYLWFRVAEKGPIALIPEIVLEYRRHVAQWRPPDTYALERKLREDFIATLPQNRRQRAEVVLRARLLHERGVLAWWRNDVPEARRCFFEMVRSDRGLITSPFVGKRVRSLLVRSVVGTMFGSRITAWLQHLVWTLRKLLGRAPGVEPLLPSVTAPPGSSEGHPTGGYEARPVGTAETPGTAEPSGRD